MDLLIAALPQDLYVLFLHQYQELLLQSFHLFYISQVKLLVFHSNLNQINESFRLVHLQVLRTNQTQLNFSLHQKQRIQLGDFQRSLPMDFQHIVSFQEKSFSSQNRFLILPPQPLVNWIQFFQDEHSF